MKYESSSVPDFRDLTHREVRFGLNNWTFGLWWVDKPTWKAVGVDFGPVGVTWRNKPTIRTFADAKAARDKRMRGDGKSNRPRQGLKREC